MRDLPARWAQHPFVIGDRWRWYQGSFVAGADALLVGMTARAGHTPDRTRSLTTLGEPEQVADLLVTRSAELLQGSRPQSVSMPPGTWQLLPADLREHWNLPRHGRWDWMWTEQVPPVHHLEDAVVQLSLPEHAARIRELQAVALPGTYFNPDRPGATWFGIWRTDTGPAASAAPGGGAASVADGTASDGTALAAVAGSYDWVHAVHLGGIGTHPDLRGAGLGGALTAAISRAAIARFGHVSLGVYADNHRAKALYARLGYAIAHEVDSRHAPF